MFRRHRALPVAIATAATLLSLVAWAPASSAATAARVHHRHVCGGTFARPGVLSGRYWDVVVHGVCVVNHGPAYVRHSIVITHNAALLAAFGRHHSRLAVGGSIYVHQGGTLVLGCEPSAFPCFDDPHPKKPSLSSHEIVGGSVIATRALGVVMHNTSVLRNVIQYAGGGGLTCHPTGIFTHFGSPVYSAYEDNMIGGSIWVRDLRSCWFGAIRNRIGRSATFSSITLADPDAMEVVSNVVLRDLTCWRNHPRVQFGDSHGTPNRVGMHAYFECGFHVILPNPAHQNKHFSHISVHLH